MKDLINTSINADCFDIFPQIETGSVDMILCDLPYGTTACKWDSILPFNKLWEQYERIIKPNGAIVLTASQPFTTDVINSNRKIFRYELIWQKQQGTNPMAAKRMPLKAHENILLFYKKLPVYNPQMQEGKPYSGFKSTNKKIGEVYGDIKSQHRDNPLGERYPISVVKASTTRKGIHPTQKPVPLFEYLIRTYTNEGDLVLDNCAGSFTTAVACDNTNRNWICIEKDEEIFLKGRDRVLAHREKLNIF